MAKKIFALIMAAVLICCAFTGCSPQSSENKASDTVLATKKVTDNSNFKLSYTQSDSLNPFKAKTQNNQVLASLVFESLFDLDESYEPILNIASSYEFTDSKTIKVKFNTNIAFSNGSPLEVEDIIYSFNAAKKSPAYGNSLKYFDYASRNAEDCVVFYLKKPNPNAVNLLTFPIASTNDDESGYPIGSGRYKYVKKDSKTYLKAIVSENFNPYITTINLVNIASADSIDNAVNIGNISYAFRDLSSSVNKRITCTKKLVNMNNLVYIGINSLSGITANAQIRKAISLACDRTVFAQSAYNGYATAATSPFNPQASIAQNVKIFSSEADSITAKQALNQSMIDSKKLKVNILVNKNNNRIACATLLKNQLEAIGFTVTIDEEGTKEYTRRVKNTEFNLYIGEVKLSDDMCLYPFFDDKSGGVRYGIDNENLTCDDLYSAYLAGECDLGKFILSFNEEMPYIPLVYKKGMICYTKAMSGDMQGYWGNFFSNIDTWRFE